METELKSFTRVTAEILGEEVSEWIVKRGNEPIVEKDLGQKIKELYKQLSGQERAVTKSYLTNIVSHVRKYLETNHKKTLVNIKGVGFKIGTPKEATVYATQIYKSFLKRGLRVERAMPLVDKRHLPESIDRVFGNSRKLLNDFTRGSQPLMLAFEDAKRGESNGKKD